MEVLPHAQHRHEWTDEKVGLIAREGDGQDDDDLVAACSYGAAVPTSGFVFMEVKAHSFCPGCSSPLLWGLYALSNGETSLRIPIGRRTSTMGFLRHPDP